MSTHPLHARLSGLVLRARTLGATAGLLWGIFAALVVMIAGIWIDLAADLPPGARLGLWGVAALVVIAVAVRALVIAVRTSRLHHLARQLDSVANAHGQIHSAVDLLIHPTPAVAVAGVSKNLGDLAITRATSLAVVIPSSRIVPVTDVLRVALLLVASFFSLLCFYLVMPSLVQTEAERLMDPYGDHPPYSALNFSVQPGAIRVLYGASVPVTVEISGGQPDRVELVVFGAGNPSGEALPMFALTASKWQATMTNVTEPGWYLLRAGKARTHKFPIDVITVPRIESARVKITPPAYTHRPAYEGPLPAAGIAGLPGTRVDLTLKSNRPLAGGQLTLPGAAEAIELKPVAGQPQEVSGSLTLAAPGKISAAVTDVDHQGSTESWVANITLLTDERPFVRILQPVAQSFATPTIDLPVELSAEDDYGISSLKLYRALNDSRPMPQALSVPSPAPTLLESRTVLPLAKYALKPGDTIKLFARVEDTNPDGARGSDSPVVVVHIISDEDMQKLILAREGLETLQAKYDQAGRRLENLDNQLAELEKMLADKDQPLTPEQQKKLDELADSIARDEKAIREAAKEDLPFDLDRALNKHLNEAADDVREAGKSVAGARSAGNATAAREKIAEARAKLKKDRGEYQEKVSDPLDKLAQIFPLQEDEARFVQLYEQQRDLAQRMRTVRDMKGADNPSAKRWMRDFEDEQRGIRQETQKLIEDIENHAAQLPEDDPKLETLRKTARDFAKAMRQQAIVEEMVSGESGLADFSGSIGHARAVRAADLMEELMGQCKSLGKEGQMCLKFNPQLQSQLGNTIEQLLAAEGLGQKPGNGAGGGGYSMRKSSLSNVGLYGKMPAKSDASKNGGGKANRGAASNARDSQEQPLGRAALDAQARQKAAGSSSAAVPPAYRRQVGDYFRRVADENGETK